MTEPKEVFSAISANLATMSLSEISANLAPMSLTIAPHNRPLLTFHPDGTISVADHVSANDAAKGVIDALSNEFGEMIARVKAEAVINTQAENAALREKLAERDALLQWFHARRFALQSKFDLHGPADFAKAMRKTFTQIDALTGGDND